ncbi:hypothetical protein AB6A40_010509 [Gnathostoma spinigerum]|uniref:Uncharacterized protein n=1 Tax=Gnathostoma spinigerum TaxID=75299 RepID=A0ABD6EWD0_9BILA
MVGSAKEDSNRWCVPPRLQPRLVDGVLCLAVLGLIKYFVGLMFTAVLFGALIVLSPFYFIYRLIQRIIGHSDRAVDSSPQMTTRCDPWWPMGGTASEQMLLTVRSNVDVDLLNDNFGRAIAASKKNHNTCCWKRDIESPHESAKIVTWNQECDFCVVRINSD